MTFFINQRWSSINEPELGSGLITKISSSKIEVLFRKAELTRIYSKQNAPLKRIKFRLNDKISTANGKSFTILNIKEINNLIQYTGNNQNWILEQNIFDEIPSLTILEKLLTGEWSSTQEYNLRLKALDLINKNEHNPNRGLVGNRIELINHQIYIARKITSRQQIRVLLADEMGLGKTIEACLILNRLLSSEIITRVLIVVPESLILQWFVELYRKFSLIFTIFDSEMENCLNEENNPFSSSQLFIISHNILKSPNLTKKINSEKWDLLIIDEAHHLKLKENRTEDFLNSIKHLILITATPTEFGEQKHFKRLNILDSDRFHNFSSYLKEKDLYPELGIIAKKLINNNELKDSDLNFLCHVLKWDLKKLNKFLKNKGNSQLFRRLLDWHGTSRVFFKNSRQNIKGFPKRIFNPHSISLKKETSNAEIKKTCNLEKTKWLKSFIKKHPRDKILLICQYKQTAQSLTKSLKSGFSSKIALFHEEMSLLERDKNAAWFAKDTGPQILICSEIGSEGRNFQFTNHLILWDLPESLGLIEQRIGRLDRIGQKETIHIHVPFIKNTEEHFYINWIHEGINLFEDFFSGIDQIESSFLKKALTISKAKDAKAMKNLIIKTQVFKKELKANLRKGSDYLLEKNSFNQQKGNTWIEQIKKDNEDSLLETFMLSYWEYIGVNIESLDKSHYLLKTTLANHEALPGKTPELFEATFCRQLALQREELFFISNDHPIVTFALDFILSSQIGETRFSYLKPSQKKDFYLQATFIIKCPANHLKTLGPVILNNKIQVTLNSKLKLINNTKKIFNQNNLHNIPPNYKEKFLSLFQKTIIKLFNESKKEANKISSKNIEESINKLDQNKQQELERLAQLYDRNEKSYLEQIEKVQNNYNHMKQKIELSSISLDSLSFIIQT